jgi:GNAT superfamily N-acetyltransferase
VSLLLAHAAHGSGLYREAVELRRRVLRLPLGLDFTPEELLAEAGDHCLVVLCDGGLAGTLSLVEKLPEVKMRQVAVEPDLQGKGIGRKLVAFAEDFARSLGAERMTLHARETAVPFYLAQGYSVVGDRFDEVGIPHFRMEKDLRIPLGEEGFSHLRGELGGS